MSLNWTFDGYKGERCLGKQLQTATVKFTEQIEAKMRRAKKEKNKKLIRYYMMSVSMMSLR